METSVGVVIFRKEEGELKFLLLHYPGKALRYSGKARDYWDFPKGHIEVNETEIDTAKREVKEETGLDDIEIIPDFKTSIKYFFKKEGKTIFKLVIFYLAETKSKEVKISPEHIGYQWLSYQQAVEEVIFKNAKIVLKKVYQRLTD